MNKLKLVIGVALVFAVGLLAGTICAGFYYNDLIKVFEAGGPPVDVRVRMLLDDFSRDLELTDTQKTEIGKILRDAQDKIFEIRRKTFPQIEEFNEKSLALIKEQLNDKQKEKFNTFDNKIKRFHDRFAVKLDFPGRPFPSYINEIKDRLSLKPEQVFEIEKIIEDIFQKREKIMDKNRKEQPPDFSKIRQEMTKLDNQEQERIERLLTEKQLEAFRKYTEERRTIRTPGPGGGPMPFNGPPMRPNW